MSYVFKERNPPLDWSEFKGRSPRKILTPFYALSWLADWAAYFLAKWPVVELLEYLGSFSILFAAIVYFVGAPDRLKQKHYQAWQVINTASGKGGNGGRIDALQELNHDHVSLTGANASGAYLQGIILTDAQARRADFADADLRDADLRRARLPDADLRNANFRGADLRDCDLSGATLNDSDLTDANLAGADLSSATLDGADLREVNFEGVKNWQSIKSLAGANIFGLKNAPSGCADWMKQHGAVEVKGD
jgi:hypothetical protein